MGHPQQSAFSVLLLLVVALSGCSAGTQSLSTAGRNLDLISRDEILAANRSTAYEVIEMVRPQWLQQRSVQSVNRQGGGILIYMDVVRYGDIASLRTIDARDLYEMERYRATAASQRWGPGHSDGVIVISTRAR